MTHRPALRRAASLLAAAVFVTLSALSAWAQQVAGKWTLDVDTPQGPMAVALVLTVEGEAVKGTVSSDMGDASFTGALAGPDVTFTFDMAGPQGPMTVKTKGTVTGDEIKGEMDYGMGIAPFTGKRAEQ